MKYLLFILILSCTTAKKHKAIYWVDCPNGDRYRCPKPKPCKCPEPGLRFDHIGENMTYYE